MNRIAIICNTLIIICCSFTGSAQPLNSSLRNYFRNPLSIPMKLSANFGELRPDHWHMGLDIRTNATENMPVYAAAEGYIAHVGIRANGYGRFIIINHPNGTSTLYAHLNDFNPGLEAYVTEQQYKKQSWAIEIDFSSSQFPVAKGAFIAYSGNTGGSQGPHLHFEIIETATQKRFNPLLFDFNLQDRVPPSIMKLALYDRGRSIYAQTPVLYSLKNTDSGYIIPKQPVIKTGFRRLSFAIQAIDRIEKGSSEDGIYSAKLYVDERPELAFILDSIQYDGRVYMNAHIDYRYDQKGGPFLQLLTQLPGNPSDVYKKYNGNGLIELNDTLVHPVRIEVRDANGNISVLNFSIQFEEGPVSPNPWPVVLAPNRKFQIERPGFSMKMNGQNLYDTVPAYYSKSGGSSSYAVTSMHSLNDPSFPLHGEVNVQLKTDRSFPEDWKDKMVMRRNSGKSSTLRKAVFTNGWVSADFGDFGSYQAFADLTPPQINELGKGDTVNLSSASRIVFTPSDNFNVIRSFRVELNGGWVRFTNDKSKNWIYKFDEKCPYGVHQLTATATDLAGNTTVKTWWFRREPYTPPPPKKKTKSKKSASKKRK